MNRNTAFIERYAITAGVSTDEARAIVKPLQRLFASMTEADVGTVDLDEYLDGGLQALADERVNEERANGDELKKDFDEMERRNRVLYNLLAEAVKIVERLAPVKGASIIQGFDEYCEPGVTR